MTYTRLFTAAATLVASSASLADVSGIVGQDTLRFYAEDGSATDFSSAAYAVMDLYVDFSAANTEGYNNEDSFLLNVFNVNVTPFCFDEFHHSDVVGGSWSPGFSLDIPGLANPVIDSFVTIGGAVGAGAATNGTALDPSFGAGQNADIFNDNVGWYAAPTAGQGGAVDLQTWIGRFVVTGDQARAGANFDIFVDVGYNYGAGTGAFFAEDLGGNFHFGIPAPAALALLGPAGLWLRRRRR